jgi:uncharacterized membrane protein
MHAVIAFASLPLFLGALLSDWAYSHSFQVQWLNFASWLIAAGLLIAGPALLWGAVDVLRSPTRRHRRAWVYLVLLLATVVIGVVNALVHAKDGFATMPDGLMLSALVLAFAATASAAGLASFWRRTA